MIVSMDCPQQWSEHIAAFAQRPLYLSSPWAEYKRRQGWRTQAMLWHGSAAALVQSRKATRFGPRLTLIQGGPVLKDESQTQAALAAMLRHANPSPWGVEILFPAQALTPALEVTMAALGFEEVAMAGTGTILLDLTIDEPELRQALSKNWRHNLSRAEKRGLSIRWIGLSAEERHAAGRRIAEMYNALTERKSFAKALDATVLTEAMAGTPDLEWLEVWQDDTLLASRMGWMGGTTALDLLAASSDAAKTTYANYLALWALIGRSRQRGATTFDCGGIDPLGNVGVYNFKKGLNGSEAHLGRLWVRTRPRLLHPLVARRLAGKIS